MEKSLIGRGANRLFWLCFIAYSASYIGRLNLSACLYEIMSETMMERTFAGSISTGYLASYGAGQLINGFLGDKISPKIMIFTGLLGSGLANVLMGTAGSLHPLLIIWCVNGFFHSMLWSPIIRCFSEWLLKEKREQIGARFAATIPVGTILSYLISAFFLKFFSWRVVFFVSGAILLSVSLIWAFGVNTLKIYIEKIISIKKDSDISTVLISTSENKKPDVTFFSLLTGTGLIFAAFAILFNGVLKDGVTQWVPTYISENFSVGTSLAALSSIILPLVNLTGAFTAAYLDKRFFKNEMKTTALMFLISIISIFLLFIAGKFNIILSVLLIGVCTSSMLGANCMLLTYMPFHFSDIGKSATVTGFLNACSYLASALSSVSIGYIADHRGWNATVFSWIIVAVLGLVICLVGMKKWGQGNRGKGLVDRV